MTRQIAILFIALLLTTALLTACAPQTISEERPADFQAAYYWSTGSLPPIYYYNYTITIGPEDTGTIVFRAGYNGEEAPVWTETFPLEPGALDALYLSLHMAGAFTETWQQMEDIPDGGSADSLDLTAYGTSYAIPSYIEEGDQASAMHAVYGMIERLVPQKIWDDLYEKHEEYVLENDV